MKHEDPTETTTGCVYTVNFLKATDREVGLPVNFGPEKAQVKRKVKDLQDGNG